MEMTGIDLSGSETTLTVGEHDSCDIHMMTSNKPYLIRALYEWLVDNDATPHILVNTRYPGVMIPSGIDKDGQVVLNIAMRAVQGLEILNSQLSFSARFGGVSQQIYIPVEAILAIYSMEDGQGMMFAEEPGEEVERETVSSSEDEKPPVADKEKKGPGLKIVK